MACMEHRCMSCNWVCFDNTPHGPWICPLCGGDLSHSFDEDPRDYLDPRDDKDLDDYESPF